MSFRINSTGHDIFLRHEEKFICAQRDLYLLEKRIQNLLPADENQIGDFYTIRSIYFDTYSDRMLHESLQGLRMRNKYRIRTYDMSPSILRLEKKIAVGSLKRKVTCRLSRELVNALIDNTPLYYAEEDPPSPLDELLCLQKTEMLRPKIIVEYDRSAYVNQTGNIRITFDRNIGASPNIQSFFDAQRITYPILPDELGILEVKYDGILPGYLARALSLQSLQRASFSKYALCRNIMTNNGRIEEHYEF